MAQLADGSEVAAVRQASDPADAGVVTVLFPSDEVAPDQIEALELTEQWFHRSTFAQQDIPVDGLPWELAEPELLDLGEGVELLVNRIELGETSGLIEWTIVGGSERGIVDATVELNDGRFDSTPRAVVPVGRVDRFFFDPATASNTGTIDLSGPTAGSSDVIVDGAVLWSVRLTVTAPASAVLPVPDGVVAES